MVCMIDFVLALVFFKNGNNINFIIFIIHKDLGKSYKSFKVTSGEASVIGIEINETCNALTYIYTCSNFFLNFLIVLQN